MEQNKSTPQFTVPIKDKTYDNVLITKGPEPKSKSPEQIAADKLERIRLEEDARKLFLQMGADYDAVKKEMVEEEKQKLAEEYKKDVEKFQEEGTKEAIKAGLAESGEQLYNISGIPLAKKAIPYAEGIAISPTIALYNTYNQIGNIYNSLYEKTPGDKGAMPLVNVEERLKAYGLSETAKAAATISSEILPLAATLTPGGFFTKLAAGSAASFFMLDPKKQTLGNLAEGTAFEKLPIVAPILQTIKKEDDDTFFTGSVKNVLEYVIPEAVVAAAVSSFLRIVSGFNRGSKLIAQQAETTATGLNPRAAKANAEIQAAQDELVEKIKTAKAAKAEAVKTETAIAEETAEAVPKTAATTKTAEEIAQAPQVPETGEPGEQLTLGDISGAEPKQYSVTSNDINILSNAGASTEESIGIINKIRNIPAEEFTSKDGRKFSVKMSTVRSEDLENMVMPYIQVTDLQTNTVIAELPILGEFVFGADINAVQQLGYVTSRMKVEYKGQGIMENAYNYARKHVENFAPSGSQTAQGYGFTNRIAMKSAITQPDTFVKQQLRRNQFRQTTKLNEELYRQGRLYQKAPEQLMLPGDLGDVRQKPDYVAEQKEYIRKTTTTDGIDDFIKEIDAEIATIEENIKKQGPVQLPLDETIPTPKAEQVVDDIPEPGTKEFEAKAKELARGFKDELAPTAQGVLRDGSRPFDDIFDKYTGEISQDFINNLAIQDPNDIEFYGEILAALRDRASKVDKSQTISHNGKIYKLEVQGRNLHFYNGELSLDEAVVRGKTSYITLGVEPRTINGQLKYLLVPSYIRSSHADREAAGLMIKMLKFTRDNVGEIQHSQLLLPAGKNFVNKLSKRAEDLLAEDYYELAYSTLERQKQDIKIRQAQAITDEQTGKRLDELIKFKEDLSQRRTVLAEKDVARYLEAQEEWDEISRMSGTDTPAVKKSSTTGNVVEVNANNSNLVEAISNAYERKPEAFTPRDPQTMKEMMAKARVIAADPNKVQKIIETPATEPIVAEERMALDIIRHSLADDAIKKIRLAQASGKDADIIVAKEALDAMTKLANKAMGNNSEAARSLGIIRNLGLLAKTGDQDALVQIGIAGRAKLRDEYIQKYGKENLQTILDQFDAIAKLDDSQFAVRFDEVVRRSKYMRTVDAMFSLYVNGLLSPSTPFTVFGSNAMVAVAEGISKFVSVGIGRLANSKDALTMIEARTFMQQLANNYGSGFEAAYKAAKEGRTKNVSFDVVNPPSSYEAAIANAPFEEIANKGLEATEKVVYSPVATSPTRAVLAADAFSNHIVMHAHLIARGTREGVERGLSGNDLTKFVDDFVAKPPDEVLSQAVDEAKRISNQRDLTDTLLGSPQKVIESDPTGLLRFFHPFSNNTTNSITLAIEYSPLSYALEKTRKAIQKGGRSRDMAYARMATGSAFTTAVGGLVAAGVLELKKDDYKQLNTLDAEGEGRISATLNVAGKSYPISWLDPLGRALNLIAHAYPSIASNESEFERSVDAVALSVAAGYLDQSAFETFSELQTFLKTTKKAEELPPNIKKMIGSAIPIPLEATAKRATSLIWSPEKGTNVSDSDEIASYFVRRLKDAYGFGLPFQRNILGYQIKEYNGLGALGPFGYTDKEVRPIYQYLRSVSDYDEKLRRGGFKPVLTIEMPEKEISVSPSPGVAGVAVRLTAQEYDDLIVNATTLKAPYGEDAKMRTLEESLMHFFEVEGKMLAKMMDKRMQEEKDPEERRKLQDVQYAAYGNQISSIIKRYYDTAKQGIASSPNVRARAYEQYKKRVKFKDSPLSDYLMLEE